MAPPVRTQKVGPGALTLGGVGDEVDISCQITSATLTPDVDQGDDVKVLCGDVVPGARTYKWSLSATLFQDWRVDGVNAFSIDYAGQSVPFSYSPDDTGGVTITGDLVVDPLAVGGDVDQRAEADWELGLVGDPVFEWESI